MSWIIKGNSERLSLGVNTDGLFTIEGRASQHEFTAQRHHADVMVLRRLEAAECNWSIHANTENEMHLDGLNTGFYEKVAQFPDRSVASIHFLEGPDQIVATIAMPHQVFERAFQLFEQVLSSPDFGYILECGFMGFREPNFIQDEPTIQEFLAGPIKGRAYISDEVSLMVRRLDSGCS